MNVDFVQAIDDEIYLCAACDWRGRCTFNGHCRNPVCHVSGCLTPMRSRERWCAPPDDGSQAETSQRFTAGAYCPATGYSGGHTTEQDNDADMCLLMIEQFGGHARSYRRERATAFRRVVSEVYSPPRVTSMLNDLRRHGLAAGFALDITCVDEDDGRPWDLSIPEKQAKALNKLRREKPLFLIGSPCCREFSTWQALNAARGDAAAYAARKKDAEKHLEFVCTMYREQAEHGRYYLHEHPAGASSWSVPCIENVMAMPGTNRIVGDQCQYGAQARRGPEQGSPICKPTGWMSNAEEVLKALERRCQGVGRECSRAQGGVHALCSGAIAQDCARYPPKLCRAILKGMGNQMRRAGILKPGCQGLMAVDDEDIDAQERCGPAQGYSGQFRDDLSGQVLKDDLVAEARAKEMAYFQQKGVWQKKPRAEAKRVTGKGAVSVRWVDTNKGDDIMPKYRSRLVARQIKALDKSGDTFFAPMPPLEAVRTVLSLAVTTVGKHVPVHDPESEERTQLFFRGRVTCLLQRQDRPRRPLLRPAASRGSGRRTHVCAADAPHVRDPESSGRVARGV